MSDDAPSPEPTRAKRTLDRIGWVLGRSPATWTLVGILLVVGVITQGLWRPAEDQPWFEWVAYGLPSFEAGRWWTPFTGTFVVNTPLVFIPTILGFVGMAYVEHRKGTRFALAWYGFGQLFAIAATSVFLLLTRGLPWPWAQDLAGSLDAGASGGTMALLAIAAGLLPAPWRQRAWIAVFGYALVGVLFIGEFADLVHAFAIALVLVIDRSFRIQRTTTHEQRIIALFALLLLGAVQVIALVLPTSGPFGQTSSLDGSVIDVAIDVVVIALVGRGLLRGRRWAWVVAVVLAAFNILTSAVLLAVLVIAVQAGALDQIEDVIGDLDTSIATGVLWLGFVVLIIATRRAFRARPRRGLGGDAPVTPATVRATIREHGGGTLSWMATWDGMDALRTTGGLVPFQSHLGVAIALGDPIGLLTGRSEALAAFAERAERQALVPCVFGADAASVAAAPAGWRSVVIADDTIVDLPGLEFTGKAWASVRQSFSRAERGGVEFSMSTWEAQPWGVRQQLKAISESWVDDKDLPEMRFTLGRLEEAVDPEVRLALAIDAEGRVDGFLSWLPVFGPDGVHDGWTLDLMRRRDGGLPPVMEFLIGSSAKHFADEGARILSLSGAPLAHEATDADGPVAALLGRLSSSLEPVYGFRSLHRFKQKFNPREEPMHLLYRDEGDLPRIAAGLTRAFLPDASVRQFASAGFDLVRGR